MELLNMRTLQTELTAALTSPVVLKAQRSATREALPDRRRFDRAVRVGNANSLDRLRWLCEAARAKPTGAKLYAAQQALLDFVGKHSNPRALSAKRLTAADFALLSNFYQLWLPAAPWRSAEQVWEYCVQLHEQDNWRNQVQRW